VDRFKEHQNNQRFVYLTTCQVSTQSYQRATFWGKTCQANGTLFHFTQKHRRALQCTWCPHAETRLSFFTAIGWEKRGSSLLAQSLAAVESSAPPIHHTHATAAWEYRNRVNPGECRAHTHTTDSEIKQIDFLGSNLINPTSPAYQNIIILNAVNNSKGY